MGYYIECPMAKGKAQYLIEKYCARKIRDTQAVGHLKNQDTATEDAVVVVVDNGLFEAAAYAFNIDEFLAFCSFGDARPKECLLMNTQKVHELTRYNPGPNPYVKDHGDTHGPLPERKN